MVKNKKSKDTKDKTIPTLIAIAVGLFAIFVILSAVNSKDSTPSEYDAFAKCLSENGAKMYGAEWCSHCKNQKALFGKSFQYVDYIECPDNQALCQNEGVTGYPTWKIGGVAYPGEQSFEKLSALTGCSLVVN